MGKGAGFQSRSWGRGQDFNPDHGEGGRISIQIMGEGQHLNPDHGEGGRISIQIMGKGQDFNPDHGEPGGTRGARPEQPPLTLERTLISTRKEEVQPTHNTRPTVASLARKTNQNCLQTGQSKITAYTVTDEWGYVGTTQVSNEVQNNNGCQAVCRSTSNYLDSTLILHLSSVGLWSLFFSMRASCLRDNGFVLHQFWLRPTAPAMMLSKSLARKLFCLNMRSELWSAMLTQLNTLGSTKSKWRCFFCCIVWEKA